MPVEHICPVCSSPRTDIFFEVADMPAHVGLLWPGREVAMACRKGDIRLAFCPSCSFIGNVAFDAGRLEYSGAYDNSLHFSLFFREYARALVLRLIERYDLHRKNVIEIGCGKGDFLALLCQLGENRGVGFDPSYEGKFSGGQWEDRLTFIRDFYSERYAGYDADLIACRYVFEHIQQPVEFLSMLRRTIGQRSTTVSYFEVPNVLSILRDLSVWDIIYEHCSYFCPASLAHVFEACDFSVRELAEVYDGQYISIEATPGNGVGYSRAGERHPAREVTAQVESFSEQYRGKVRQWKDTLHEMHRSGKRIVLWGAGAKGVAFLNMLGIREQIDYAVDINPNKKGMFIAGTGQQIVSPAFLQEYRPDAVIVMNKIYRDEIRQSIEEMGLCPEILCA